MDPITYSSLAANRPQLAPVPVPIEGLSNPILIHTFSLADYEEIIAGEGDDEKAARVQILRFLGGKDADVSDAAITQLTTVFTAYQLREILRKAMRINGHGPAALGDAEKK